MAAPPPPPPASDRWKRLAVTLACLAAGIGLPHLGVGLPGVDLSAAEPWARSMSPGASGAATNLGVFALGLMPVLSAMSLVELAAAAIPRLRPLRHGGPEGRAKLSRASGVVALVLALLQGFGIAKLAEALSANAPVVAAPGWGFRLVAMVTLATGTAVLLLVAYLAGVRGLVSGIGLIMVGSGVDGSVRRLVTEVLQGKATGRSLAVYSAGAALTAAVTWIALRDPRPGPAPGTEPAGYRAPPPEPAPAQLSIPAPASGVGALLVAMSLVSLLGMAPGVGQHLQSRAAFGAATAVAVVALGVMFSAWFNAPHRIAGVLSRARAKGEAAPRDPALTREARRALRRATLESLAFLGAILTISRLTADTSAAYVEIALLTALVLDAAAELRARREVPDLVPVWPEHRPYAVQAAREALARAEIFCFARGEKLRRLLQFGGPFVPIDLMVPRADAKRAAKILDRVLRFHPEDEEAGAAEKVAAPWTRRERGLLAAAAALAVVPVAVAAWPAPAPPPRGPVRADALLLLEVDDDDDLFSPEPTDLARGVSIQIENAPVGPGRSKTNHFARIMASGAADLDASRARLLAWAEPLAAARGLSVRVGPVSEMNPDSELFDQIGWRTYLVRGAPVLDARDVRDASAVAPDRRDTFGGWAVRVALGEAGAERFRAFTASHVKRRLAIVVDDRVESAPVIHSEIPGGVVSITMGAGAPEEQQAQAQRLADRLMGR